jgi:hypothetical protein
MKKCKNCKKKSIIRFNCKCGKKKLCLTCLKPEKHNCSFDEKTENQEKLKKNLVSAKFKKIDKI